MNSLRELNKRAERENLSLRWPTGNRPPTPKMNMDTHGHTHAQRLTKKRKGYYEMM